MGDVFLSPRFKFAFSCVGINDGIRNENTFVFDLGELLRQTEKDLIKTT